MKITNEPIEWPIWLLPVIVLMSTLLPVPTCRYFGQIEDRFYVTGLVLVSLRYLRGWRRGAPMADLVIYSITGIFMPYISILFVQTISRFI